MRSTDPVMAVLTQETDHEQAVVTENKLTHNCGTLQISEHHRASSPRAGRGASGGSPAPAAKPTPTPAAQSAQGRSLPLGVSVSSTPMDHSAGHLAGSRSPAYAAAMYSHGVKSPPKMISPGSSVSDGREPVSRPGGGLSDGQPSTAALRSGLQQSFRTRKAAPSSTGYSRRPGSLDRRPQSPLWRVTAGHLSDSGSSPERRDVNSPPEKSRKKRVGPYDRPQSRPRSTTMSGRHQRTLSRRSRSDSHLQMAAPSPEPRDHAKAIPRTGRPASSSLSAPAQQQPPNGRTHSDSNSKYARSWMPPTYPGGSESS